MKGTQKIHYVTATSPYAVTCKLFPNHDHGVKALLRTDTHEQECRSEISDSGANECTKIGLEADLDNGSSTLLSPTDAIVGSWIAVVYNIWVPGTIEELLYSNGKVRMRYMRVIGPNRFMWPADHDFDVIDYDTVLAHMKICPEIVSSGRGGIYHLFPPHN